MKIAFTKALSMTGLVAAAALGVSGTAQAGPVVGSWDPAFSGSISGPFGGLTGLGWKGTASFTIPNACLNPSETPSVNTATPCVSGNGGFGFLGASVDFYDIGNFNNPIATMSVTGMVVNSMDIDGTGQVPLLNSVHTAGWSSSFSTSATNYSVNDYDFYLMFDLSGQAVLKAISNNPYNDPWGCGFEGGCLSDPVDVHYTPEPGSLYLMFGALGAIGLLSSRRRRLKV